MNLPQINVTGVFFNPDGTPTMQGQVLIRAVNTLAARTGGIPGVYFPFPTSAVADLPATAPAGSAIYCTNEAGGEVLVVMDSAGAWRRQTDRAIAS